MTKGIEHVVWSEWDDLKVPAGIRRLSPATAPLDQMDAKTLSEITFYVSQIGRAHV